MGLTPDDIKAIDKEVMEKYPKSEGERKCRREKEAMKRVRDHYRNKLISKKLEEKYNAV